MGNTTRQSLSKRAAANGQRKNMRGEKVNILGTGGMVVSNGALSPEELMDYKRFKQAHTPKVYSTPKIGRNELCPCGSGKKFKRCHLLIEDKIRERGRDATSK